MKNLMKTSLTVLAMAILLAMGSCGSGKAKLAKMVKEADKECPWEMGVGMVNRVTLDDDVVKFECSTNGEAFQNLCNNLAVPEYMKLFQRDFVTQLDKELYHELVSNNVGVKFVIDSGHGGKKEVGISVEELEDAKKNPLSGDQRLDMLVEITQKQLPIAGEQGVKVTEVSKHSRILFIVSDLSDSGITKEQLSKNIAHLGAFNMFTRESIASDPMLLEAVNRGYDVEFVYKSSKFDGTEKIHLSNYSLKKVLGKI